MRALAESLGGGAAWPTGALAAGLLASAVVGAGVGVDLLLAARWVRRPGVWRGRLAVLQSRPWSGAEAGLLLLTVLCVYAAGGVLTSLLPARWRTASSAPLGAAVVLQTVLLYGAVLGVTGRLLRRRGLSWSHAFGLRALRPLAAAGWAGVAYLAAIPATVLGAALYQWGLNALGYPVELQDVARVFLSPDFPRWLQVCLAVTAVTLAPVVEEICFRGVLLPALLRECRPWLAVTAVSVLFAVVHFHVPSFVPLCLLGGAFAVSYLASGSLCVPVLMHALFNAVSMASLVLLRDAAGPG